MQWNPWRWPLAQKILGGLALGAALGLVANQTISTPEGQLELTKWLDTLIVPVGQLFIRIIFMIVIPLIFAAIVLGVAGMGDLRRLGRIGLKTLGITLALSAISVLIGLALVNTLQPGRQLPPEARAALEEQYRGEAASKVEIGERASPPLAQTLLNLIPQNPLAEAANAFTPNYTGGGLLAVMVFSVFFGVAVAMLPAEKSAGLLAVLDGLFGVCMAIIGFAMKLAPLGVACLAFALTARLGLDVLRTLGLYAGVVLLGLALHMFVTYPLALKFVARMSPLAFFKGAQAALVTAFGTSSSNATLPVSLRVAEEKLGLPAHVSRFVLTVGASANQNGTALYEGVTVLFLAQVFGVELTLAEQFTVALMCILAGIGTAGVPGGSLPLVVGVLVYIQVPGDAIAIILGIDRLLDMCRTTLNVAGDLVCAAIVSRGETAPAKSNTDAS